MGFLSPVPSGDAERVRRLHALGVLYSGPSPAFDRICQIAKEHLDVPIALVTFLDTHYQWYKARIGLEDHGTRRDIAFCAHTIMSDDPMIVEDTLLDPLFCQNPLVTGAPHIRFYAGVPIVLPGNIRLGAVCVVDRKPRKLTTGQLAVLKHLGSIAATELRLIELARTMRRELATEADNLRVAS